jgi:branched-chain amino acid aminotransferase
MYHFNYNGKMVAPGTAVISVDNRGLRYGDGLFETIRYQKGSLTLIDEHFARLWNGMQLLQFDIPRLLTPDYLQEQVHELLKKNKLAAARVRINVFRGPGSLYDAKNIPLFTIETANLPNDVTSWNENGLHLTVFRDTKKMADHFANCKHNNFLPYFMGALYAKAQKCNDAIILNHRNTVADTTKANIFLVKEHNLFTPSLSEGCVAGVMRKNIIKCLDTEGISVTESEIPEHMVAAADEIFLTNALYPIRWVSNTPDKIHTNTFTRKIYDLLCKTNRDEFC